MTQQNLPEVAIPTGLSSGLLRLPDSPKKEKKEVISCYNHKKWYESEK
jgi:hypothetical protein